MELSPQTFNHEVTKLRSIIKRGKVFLANKNTKMSQMLRNKKAEGSLKEKNIKKADKLREEIIVVNKLKKDRIGRFILTHSVKEIDQFLSCHTASLEERCMAKIARLKAIVPIIKKFHDDYPNWKDELEKFSEKKEKPKVKQKNEASEIKSKNLKPKDDKRLKQAKKNVFIVTEEPKNESIPVIEKSEVKELKSDSFFITGHNPTVTKVEEAKIETPMEVKELKSDPFFITRDNKEYMSYCSIENKAEEPKMEQIVARSVTKGKKNQQKKDFGNKFIKSEPEPVKILHPSWAAKKKLSGITKFQGKKIKFDV